jgi:hypothetical protein
MSLRAVSITTGMSMGTAVAAKLAANIKTVDVGKHQVQEQDVREVLPGHTKSGLAILGDDRLEIARPENPGDKSRLIPMVFHDQSRCHGSVPRGASPCLNPS